MRSLVAIAAGAGVAAGLFHLGAIVALLVVVGLPLGAPGGPPSGGYYVINLGLAAVAAVLGGGVSAWVAGPMRRRPCPCSPSCSPASHCGDSPSPFPSGRVGIPPRWRWSGQ
jgi:hypothetical protein